MDDELQQKQNKKLHPDSCTLLEALSLNDTFLAAEIVQNPNQKHKGTRCYKEYKPLNTNNQIITLVAKRFYDRSVVFPNDQCVDQVSCVSKNFRCVLRIHS